MCRQPTEKGNDITPRPLHIKRVKKSPSMPFRKRGRAQEEKENDRASSTGFLGMKFRSSPRAHSSCAGVLGKDGVKEGPIGTEISIILGAEKVQNGAVVERGWPG